MKFPFFKKKTETHSNEVSNEMYLNAIVESIEQIPFAIANENVCYAGLNELAGYLFFQTIIVGKLKTKTFKGASLKIIGDDFELNLKSDMQELESNSSKIPNRYITPIDFIINESEAKKIDKSKIKTVTLIVKNITIDFECFEAINDEEE
jgi:hypothetical protein